MDSAKVFSVAVAAVGLVLLWDFAYSNWRTVTLLVVTHPIQQPLTVLVAISMLLGFALSSSLFFAFTVDASKRAAKLQQDLDKLRGQQAQILNMADKIEVPITMAAVIRNNVFGHTAYDFATFASRVRAEPRPAAATAAAPAGHAAGVPAV